jgi:XTP/dITP diphosphohydrolase
VKVSTVRRLVLASGNAGKLKEIGHLLAPLDYELISQSSLQVSEAEEPFGTFLENALAKARHAAQATGFPALADDSGLCVPALHYRPGVLSARFAAIAGKAERIAALGADAANNEELLNQLALTRGNQEWDFPAYFACVLVMVRHAQDPEPLIAQGRWNGKIVEQAQGDFGFGYDPYFFVPSLGKTAAQLPPAEKNLVSHRGQAMQRLLDALQGRL